MIDKMDLYDLAHAVAKKERDASLYVPVLGYLCCRYI